MELSHSRHSMNICWCQPDLAACSALAPHRGTELPPKTDPITSGYLCDSFSKRQWACHHICIWNRCPINGCWINSDHSVCQKSETLRSHATCLKHLISYCEHHSDPLQMTPNHILSCVEAANEDRGDNLEIPSSPNSWCFCFCYCYRHRPLPSLLKLIQMSLSIKGLHFPIKEKRKG